MKNDSEQHTSRASWMLDEKLSSSQTATVVLGKTKAVVLCQTQLPKQGKKQLMQL
jgi:hypothetical protein